MQLDQVVAVANRWKAEMPKKIVRDLTDVEIMVAPDVAAAKAALTTWIGDADPESVAQLNSDVPDDCKGIFLGDPMETVVSDPGDGEEDMEESVTLPEGIVVLIASNIESAEDAAIVLLHETGHALGMKEEEVEALGLGMQPKPPVVPPVAQA